MYVANKWKSATLVLALLMLLTLVSCNHGTDKTPSGTGGNQNTGEQDNRLPIPVEAEDNGWRDFRILMPETNTIDVPKETGSFVSQVLFSVDSKVEEYLGVTISYTAIPGNWANKKTFNNRLMGMSLSDYAEFDLIMAETSASYSYALQNGLVLDLTQINELELSHPWYLENMVDTYGINGKLFGARGDVSLTTYETLGVVYFNSGIIANYDLEDPYTLVRNREWTAEAMFNMALEIEGTSSSEQVDLRKDTFGYLGQHVATRGYMIAFHVDLVEKNGDDGNYYLKESADENLINKWTYLYNLFEQYPNQIYSPVAADAKLGVTAFADGRSLFYNGFFSHAPTFVASEVQWGVVPLPMYNLEQGRYYTPAGTQAMMLMIMVNPYSVRLSAKVLELKSYYNYYEAVPKYYEDTLGYQYGTSAVHIEMMNLIRETATLTFIGAMSDDISPSPYNMFSMDDYIRKNGESAACLKGSLSTWYSTNVASWNAHLKDLYKRLK